MTVSPPVDERRFVSLMSVDIVGSTRLVAGLDPDDAQALLDSVFENIQAAVERRAGSIISFTGDGALIVFGWPEPNERHADSACEAAWDIQSTAGARQTIAGSVELRVGIASGRVAVRRIELGFVSRHDVIGEAVHRAAALQKHAPPGGILLCESTRGLSRLELAVESRKFDLGLRTGLVRCFLMLDKPRASPGALLEARHRYPVIGREMELERLKRLLDNASNAPAALACVAEPGLGKSRLAAAAAQMGVERDMGIVIHESRELERITPFAGARALVLAALGMEPGDVDPDRIAQAFDRAVGTKADRAATLAVFETADATATGQRSEPASQTRVARALAEMLCKGAIGGPSLVILEDLHNLDPESRQVLSFVVRASSAHAVALFITGRPEAVEAVRNLTPDIIEMGALTDDAIARLADHVEQNAQLGDAARREVVRRSAGNPFVLTQLVENQTFAPDRPGATVMPGSVESLIHARLDRLHPAARSLAQSLSLLGESIEADIALAAGGEDAEPGSEAMAELQKLAFLHISSVGTIRFRHALIAGACASSISRARRREIHNAAVEALLLRQADLPNLYPRLAHHAVEGGRDEQAIEFFWRAARRARSLTASQSLMDMIPQALACCDRLGQGGEARFVDLVLLAFETFHLRGEIDRIEAFLPRAAEAAEREGRRDKVCIARCHQGIAAWYHGRFVEGERIMRPALEEAKMLGHLPLRFAAQFILAQQLHNQARIDEALGLIGELCELMSGELELARLGAMGLPASIAHCHAGYYSLETGQYEAAQAHLATGLSIAERGADPYSESLACIALGRCLLLTGRNGEALDVLLRGEALIEQQGYDPALLNVSGLLATALTRLGRAEEAIVQAEARLDQGLLSRTGSYERHYFHCGYGEALVRAGRVEEGLAAIDAALEIARSTSNNCILVQSLALKAAMLARLSRDATIAAELAGEVKTIEARYGLHAPAHHLMMA